MSSSHLLLQLSVTITLPVDFALLPIYRRRSYPSGDFQIEKIDPEIVRGLLTLERPVIEHYEWSP